MMLCDLLLSRIGSTQGQASKIEYYFRHQDHNKGFPYNNDIALIKLKTKVTLDGYTNIACLPEPSGPELQPWAHGFDNPCYITGTLNGAYFALCEKRVRLCLFVAKIP